MSPTVRRLLGVLVAGLAVAVAAVVFLGVRTRLELAAGKSAHLEVEDLLGPVTAELRTAAGKVATTAAGPTRFDAIKPILELTTSASDRHQLAETLSDFRNEPYFHPYMLGHYAWFLGASPLVSDEGDVASVYQPLAVEAASSGSSSAVVPFRDRVWLAGAGRSEAQTPQQDRLVFVLLQEITSFTLEPIAVSRNVAVALMPTGKTDVAVSAGGGAAVEALRRSINSMTVNDAPCCAQKEIFPGVTAVLWRDPSGALADASAEATRTGIALFAGAGLLAVLALFFGFRAPRRSGEEAELLARTAEQLKQSQEQLQRLSQQLTTTGSTPALQVPVVSSGLGDGLMATQASAQRSRYEIVAPLGEGGMAKVSVAVVRGAEGFRRSFVLKRLRAELAGNQEAVNQFIDEARLGASLVHSNIVPVFDFGRDDEGYFLAQEYIVGRDVDALVTASKQRRNRPLEPAIASLIAQEALKALSYAHAKRNEQGRAMALVHRDVSPNNLMVSARGEVKLLDFGIVKSDDRVTRTQAGMVKGNLFFMSPEQARALEVDARSDLFSMGMVLVTMLTGEPLYSGNNVYELMTRAAAGPNGADMDRIEQQCGVLAPVILRALAVDPAARFETADAFAHALAAAVPAANPTVLQHLMDALFADDFAAERQRFGVGT